MKKLRRILRALLGLILYRFTWLHVISAIGLGFLLIILVSFYLKIWTNHGETVSVPDLIGLELVEAETYLEQARLRVTIMDSGRSDRLLPGQVMRQDPPPGATAKEDRVVYLTIVAKPRLVQLPAGMSTSLIPIRNIEKNGIDGFRISRDYEYIAHYIPGMVKHVKVNGKIVKEGDQFPEGTMLTLVVTSGLSPTTTEVPDLTGNTIDIAEIRLLAQELHIELILTDESIKSESDSLTGRIFKQSPPPFSEVKRGRSVNVTIMEENAYREWEMNQVDSTRHRFPGGGVPG